VQIPNHRRHRGRRESQSARYTRAADSPVLDEHAVLEEAFGFGGVKATLELR
jgi:hypothetical protein